MTERALNSLLRSALNDLRGDAVAIGAVAGGTTESSWSGNLAGEPLHGRTVFYGASLTKQIVGVLAARAVLQGALDVDDSIVGWVPELPDVMERVRLTHLIHHTSDLPDVTDPAAGVPGSNAEVLERFRQLETLTPEPGVRYAYNNAGYVLLAEAVARSLHQPISVLAAELCTPLGMSDTRLGGSVVRLTDSRDPPGTIGDGGVWTSLIDLTRWLQAANAAAFGHEVQRLVESTTRLTDGSSLDYAWGVRVRPSPAGRIITHGGSWDQWLAKTVRIPEHGVAVAILSVGAEESEISRTTTGVAEELAAHLRPAARSGGR